MPTESQMFKCLVLCQMLSNLSRPIQLFRYEDKRKKIFILAGEQGNIEITIFEEGNWKYYVAET